MPNVVVVNASHPEVNNIARAMSEQGWLQKYYRPYTSKGRFTDRLIDKIAGESSANRAVEGIKPSEIHEVALGADFKWLTANIASRKVTVEQRFLDDLMHARTASVARAAAKRIKSPDLLICDIGTALEPFESARKTLKILNYPIARHGFAREYLIRAAAQAGAFSETVDITSYPDWVEERFEKEVAMADLILVGSSFVAHSFISTGVPESKIRVIPYGTDSSKFTPKNSGFNEKNALKLIFVGKIGERKGISYLDEAFKVLKRENVQLTMVGDAIGGQKTLSLLDEDIRHIPHCSQSELSRLYKDHDAFVFPSLVEGMGLVVLEAMSSGIPVITTPNGPGDIVRDGVDGIHITPMSSDSIIDAVRTMLNNPNLLEKMGSAAAERAKSFSWANYRTKITNLVRSCI